MTLCRRCAPYFGAFIRLASIQNEAKYKRVFEERPGASIASPTRNSLQKTFVFSAAVTLELLLLPSCVVLREEVTSSRDACGCSMCFKLPLLASYLLPTHIMLHPCPPLHLLKGWSLFGSEALVTRTPLFSCVSLAISPPWVYLVCVFLI